MKKYILPTLIFISVFVGTLLLHTYVTPRKARPIISLTLLGILIAKKIYDKKFSKIDFIFLSVGFILMLSILIRIYLRN